MNSPKSNMTYANPTKTMTIALCFIGGLCLTAALQPIGLWPLVFVGIAILDLLIANQDWRSRFYRTWLLSAVWLYSATLWMFDMTPPGYLIAGALMSSFFGFAAALTPPGKARKLVLPGTIALAELFRWSWPFGGIPLANLALTQTSSPLIYASRIFGSLLIVVLTVVLGQALASTIQKLPSQAKLKNLAIPLTVVAIFVVAGMIHPRSSIERTATVALVQGGGPQNTRAATSDATKVLQRHIEASALVTPETDLIVWPENTVNPGPGQIEEFRTLIDQVASTKQGTVLAGWFYAISDTKTVNYHSAIDQLGTQLDRYDKVRIVPFGEFVPFRGFLEQFSSELPRRDVQQGRAKPVLDTPVGPVGVSISWEGFFDVRSRDAIKNGAELLTNPTNGASFWLTQVQNQQIQANRIHAVENDRWLLQVAPTGLTAVINPDGEVLEVSEISEQRVFEQTVEMRAGRTLASYVGFWPVGIYGLLAAVSYPLVVLLTRKREQF